MKRFVLSLIIVVMVLSFTGSLLASSSMQTTQEPVPTLVPPTLVPVPQSGDQEIVATESTVARIQRNGVVRVGILYNAVPFGYLDVRGNVTGLDADIARSLVDAWDLDIEFVQVTRQIDSAVQMLRTGEIDLLASSLVHRREWDSLIEFSQAYYLDGQYMMVRADDPATVPSDLNERRLGVVVATPSETAVNAWMPRSGVNASVETFLTLDRAYVALAEGRVDAVVDTQVRLEQVSALQPDTIRIMETAMELEPHALAVQRQDVSMRNLVNHTLQYLTQTGRMVEIAQVYFPGATDTIIPVWNNIGEEAPMPVQYAPDLSFPSAYIVPQILGGRALRVAGIFGVTGDSDAPPSERRLDTFHRTIFDEMGRRWGVSIEYLPATAEQALEMVANGQADVAVGVEPDWNWANRVDYTQSYLLRGMRLMVVIGDELTSFSQLGGREVVTPNNDPLAATIAVQYAQQVNASIEIIQTREQDIAFVLLEDLDADVAFGDSIRLLSHIEQFPEALRITTAEDRESQDPWYSQQHIAFAVTQNDIEFRRLVDYTLQEFIREGWLQQLLLPLMLPEDIPDFMIFPGSSEYMGLSLGS